MATILERKGRYTARVRKGGITRTKTFATYERANYWAMDLERNIQRGIDHGKIDPTGKYVHSMIDSYIAEAERNPNISLGNDKRVALNHVKEFFSYKPIASLSAKDVVAFAKHRSETVGPATIRLNIAYLSVVLSHARGVWDWDISEKIIDDARTSLKAQGLVAESTKRDRILKRSEERALLRYLDNFAKSAFPVGDVVRFQLASAFRVGETLRLRWDDYDAEEGTILVRGRKHPDKRQKATRVDEVPLTNAAMDVIERQERHGELIFPYKVQTVSSAFVRAQERLELEHVTLHDCRHTALTRFAEAGLSLAELQVISGHTSPKHLMRYLHVRPKTVRGKIAHL